MYEWSYIILGDVEVEDDIRIETWLEMCASSHELGGELATNSK